MIHSIVHLVDDSAWGGVNRLLSGLADDNQIIKSDRHEIVRVVRGAMRAPKIEADLIVSHMSVCWANVPFFTSLRGQNPDTPLVHVEHSYSECFVARNVGKRDRFEDLISICYSLFDKVVAVSTVQGAWMLRRGFCLKEQLFTISSCVPLDAFREVSKCATSGPVTVGAMGRFHKQKGFDILVEAFARLRDANLRLLLVGDGEEKSALQAAARGQPNIVFKSRTENPAAAIAECDVIAMPSRWEPFGLVALEAAAGRRPVLCSPVDGLRQHVECGAVPVPENTPAAWIAVLAPLANRDAVSSLPISTMAEGAEDRFAEGWRLLVEELCRVPHLHQAAA